MQDPTTDGCVYRMLVVVDEFTRDEFLDGKIFYTLKQVQVLTERWRWQYSQVRPHQSLGYRTPAPEAPDWPLAASREDRQPATHKHANWYKHRRPTTCPVRTNLELL